MDTNQLREKINDLVGTGKNGGFDNIIAFIDENFEFIDCVMTINQINSFVGQNVKSKKIYATAILLEVDITEALTWFGKYYRDVCNTPNQDNHANIRNVIRVGIENVYFSIEGLPLKYKN